MFICHYGDGKLSLKQVTSKMKIEYSEYKSMFQCAHLINTGQTAARPVAVATEDVIRVVQGVWVAVIQDGWMLKLNAQLVKCDL